MSDPSLLLTLGAGCMLFASLLGKTATRVHKRLRSLTSERGESS